MISVVWFKRDLRVHDHAALNAACADGGPVLGLYVLEPDLWRQPEMAGRHFSFLLECLEDLRAGLAARGGALVIKVGEAAPVLDALHRQHTIKALHAHEETGLLWTYARDRAVRRWARRSGVMFLEHRQNGVWRAQRTRNGWAQRWDAVMRAPILPAPGAIRSASAPSDDLPDAKALGLAKDPCPERQTGGRRSAIVLLGSFLTERGRPYRRAMSSPEAGAHACSRLSAHLALGCLSMRETHQAALRALMRSRRAGDEDFSAALRSFRSRLQWRCHFIQKLEDEPSIETTELHPAYRAARPVGADHAALVSAWIEGRTGFPFLDACMRSLAATGWLNFRMRAMAMAFSSYHLWQDWRAPARALARRFTDFEPGIHYPQVQMQSGTTGVNVVRLYNPVKQSLDQDAEGGFIRRWVPELAQLPTAMLHTPWSAPESVLAAKGIVLGKTYPLPLVDHEEAARRAREAAYALRQGEAYHQAAQAIQDRHGSRRSGLAPTYQRRRQARPNDQGELDL